MELPMVAPKNAKGPFVAYKSICISCEAPLAEAPSLMAWDHENTTCYFRRQPETPEQVDEAVNAVYVSCCGGIRYLGDDPEILRKIAADEHQGPWLEPPKISVFNNNHNTSIKNNNHDTSFKNGVVFAIWGVLLAIFWLAVRR